MNCKRAENFLVRSFDGPLPSGQGDALRGHLEDCPACRQRNEEYDLIREAFRAFPPVQPRPFFWERLNAKLPTVESSPRAWPVFRKLGFKLVPAYLAVILALGAALVFLGPPAEAELSQAEILLRGEDPLTETTGVLDETRAEDKNMMILFASLERPSSLGSRMP
ncbi:MAG: zf-HC2 domain-containing protein [Candidatus Aminicenantes bacterium]|nr:zf-HC2 domain-containing protein [Candidatus Aminicenantes bacterium]